MHITCVLGLSYGLIHLSQRLGSSYFLGWFAGLAIFSVPVFLLVILREKLFQGRGSKYWLAWTGVFVLYPILLFAVNIDVNALGFSYLYNLDIDGSFSYSLLAVSYLALEVLLVLSSRKSGAKSKASWLQSNKGSRLAIVMVGLFSLFMMLSNNFMSKYLQDLSPVVYGFRFVSYFIQLFIIYISYYFYYYIHHHVLYSGILREKGFIAYFLGLGLVILAFVPIHNSLISFFPVVQDLKLHPMGLTNNLYDDLNYSLAILVLIFSFPLIVTIEWYKQANALAELEQAKSKTELDLLRQQINPHFFFNTLNNLYAMSLTQEEDTPQTILQLSELMRYVIYKGKERVVSISDEVKYINDYIDLQMIRIHKNVDLKFDVDIENEHFKIPPLLFIILIENAFKHGIEKAASDGLLHITLKERDNTLLFECINSIEQNANSTDQGIGLDNLRKRLAILYPDRHELILEKSTSDYKALLTIEL